MEAAMEQCAPGQHDWQPGTVRINLYGESYVIEMRWTKCAAQKAPYAPDPRPIYYRVSQDSYPLTRRALAASADLRNGKCSEADYTLSVLEAFAKEKPADVPDSPSYTVSYIRWLLRATT